MLAFLSDIATPFDHSQAERDSRLLNMWHKVSGGFLADPGAQQYARMQGDQSTVRTQGLAVRSALQVPLPVHPLLPSLSFPECKTI